MGLHGGMSTTFLRALVTAGRQAGVDVDAVLSELGIEAGLLGEPDALLEAPKAVAVWSEIPRRSGDEVFGLHAAERAPTGTFGVLEFACLASRTAGAAMEEICRYYRLMSGVSDVVLERRGALASLAHRTEGGVDEALRHAREWFFAAVVLRLGPALARPLRPVEVRLAHGAPRGTGEHERIFAAPLRFGQPSSELVFEASVLDEPLLTADPALLGALERFGDELLRKRVGEGGLRGAVREAAEQGLSAGDPSLGAAARRLRVSERTLQRRLQAERLSYQEILDEVRRAAAERLVGEGVVPIYEVGFLLGFAQPSAFTRAFRRWTGLTPVDYRAHGRTGPGPDSERGARSSGRPACLARSGRR